MATTKLCDCTGSGNPNHHTRGEPGCAHAPGGDGTPMAIDPETGELARDKNGDPYADPAAKPHPHKGAKEGSK